MEYFQYSIHLIGRNCRNYLSVVERKRFIEVAQRTTRPEIQTFALTLVYTGCRISEALSLRACDVDLSQQMIYIFTRKKDRKYWREIPIPSEFVRALELVHRLRKNQSEMRLSQQLMWEFSRTTAFRYINELMKQADIQGPQASSNGLRQGFGVAAVEAGVPLPTIAAVLGHSSVNSATLYAAKLVHLTDLSQIERMW